MVNVRPANNGENIQLRGAHPIERHMERLVRVNVGKIQPDDQIPQLLGRFAVAHALFDPRQSENSDYASFIDHRPGVKFSLARSFERLPYGHF